MWMLIALNIIYLINHNMYKMGIAKEINIKNRTYYFYNDIINLDEFDESKIKVDKKDFNDIDIFIILVMNIRKKLQNVI